MRLTLIPIAIVRHLSDSLAGGDIYRISYRPRASVVDSPTFILASAVGIFLLQCKPCLIDLVRLDQPIVLEDEVADEDDLWDDWYMKSTDGDTGGDTW